ncbi:MAG: ComF family protein [Bacteroidales bacterium]|nr:ComF family protein [Bacteroidales bacterium]
MNFLLKSAADFIGLIFPQLCPSCGKNLFLHEKVICSECLYHLPRLKIDDYTDNPVARLFWGRVEIMYSTAMFYYIKGSKYQNIIHNLKYQGQQHIGTGMGRMFGHELAATPLQAVDIVVPVPLHPRKLRKRGFNQSELIARGIAEGMGKNTGTGILERVTDTDSQTRRSRYQRWENVESIFKVKKPAPIANKHVLLIDDVVTTGSTLESCATEILKIEGTKVSVAALAVAKYG